MFHRYSHMVIQLSPFLQGVREVEVRVNMFMGLYGLMGYFIDITLIIERTKKILH